MPRLLLRIDVRGIGNIPILPTHSVSLDGLRGFSSRTQIAQMFHEIARKYR